VKLIPNRNRAYHLGSFSLERLARASSRGRG